ncbi:MAG: hypothetical protein A3E82_03740 [Gammaproteobacteria bacterium RIFCSPHIGHO2_12_FULL_38_11]|nr:MAG: hypothetical protein A3E82_03740 [Gammaproteobacteria bacterium RIFCSPHIGHO2_12_FULL_38_11]
MTTYNHKSTCTQKVTIPERTSAPETQLHVKIVTQNKNEMGSRPVIFILPGGPGLDHSTYQSYNCLLDVADIVFHDPRGCGQSEKGDPSTYSMENYVDDVDILRQSLNLKNIIPLGKSYGSVCAMAYALRYKNSIAKLILSAGAPSYRSLETAKQNLLKLGTPKQINIFEKVWNGSFKSHKELSEFYAITAPLYSNHIKTRLEAYALTYFSKNFSYDAMNWGFTKFLPHFDFEPELHLIEHNTLILAGEDDWINDIKHIKLMAEKIPNNTLKIFSDAGHAIESDIGKPYFEEIRKFIINAEALKVI